MASINSDHAGKSAKKAASNVTHIGDIIPDTLKETAEQVVEQAGDAIELVRDSATDAFSQVRKFAKKNPLATVAIGFGAGLLLGAILRRD